MLFSSPSQELLPDFWLLPGFASSAALLPALQRVAELAPFRHWQVPGGKQMAVAMTNCGALGWTSSAQGYRYLPHDPKSALPWPAMPPEFVDLARCAVLAAGFAECAFDACLINRYETGAGMGLHQDKDEADLSAPIVSVSMGASAKFMLGGLSRSSPVRSIALHDGDVLVWGGQSRLVFHGIRPLPASTEQVRFNLTFRKAA